MFREPEFFIPALITPVFFFVVQVGALQDFAEGSGTVADFKYSEVMQEAGEKGLVWSEESLASYLPDPSKFLEEFSGDDEGKSKMTFKLTKGAEDMAAYLASVAAQ